MKNKKFVSRRIIAGFIDYSIILGLTYLYIYKFGSLNDEGEYSVNGFKTIPIIIFWFIYLCVIEVTVNSTLGNFIVRLTPVDLQTENKITLKQSFLRHIVDLLDMFFFGLVAIIIIKNSNDSQRLGDLLAKTKVIEAD
ncbi:RDD family protein [Epilithonimonas sp. JDS]|uniref:RDD family protein n=1 Tax=Epilithonimonas sp. JDS TaxID=2902797 RepID=UPI001E38A076|nr:RDD family protein [Epilithonimonas sp. JDS]MCD9853100.1 RDD family protein [Epilithonimonas sp. JDS]